MKSREATIFSVSVSKTLSKTHTQYRRAALGTTTRFPNSSLSPGFTIQSKLAEKENLRKEHPQNICIPASSYTLCKISFYFAVLLFFYYFYLLTYLDDENPALRSVG